jgi:hypothetical protein
LAGWNGGITDGDRTDSTFGEWVMWVVKINASGNKIWDKCYGTNGTRDEAHSIIATGDGGFAVLGGGHFHPTGSGGWNFRLFKANANGEVIWSKFFGGDGHESGKSLCLTNEGGFLVVGGSPSGIGGDKSQASRGNHDFWSVKFDGNGNKIWDRRFGGSLEDNCYDIVATNDGGYLIVGDSNSPADGDKSETSRGGTDFWAIKINSEGVKVWDKRFGGSGSDICNDIIATSNGGFLLGGSSDSGFGDDKSEGSRGESDFWLVKIDADGNK